MRILHLLDHSSPRQSAYASRTMAILRQQRAVGWHTSHFPCDQPRDAQLARELSLADGR